MTLLKLEVLHVKCGSSCKMLHTSVTMLVPPVGSPSLVIGGEGMIHLNCLALKKLYLDSFVSSCTIENLAHEIVSCSHRLHTPLFLFWIK